MIAKPTNWENIQIFTERKALPLDAYVCKIKKAAVQQNVFGDQLCVLFDISEGDFARFYDEDFKTNPNSDKKWRGVLRLFLPSNDGSDKDEMTKRTLKGFVTAVEKSNPGYVWNWDEMTLMGRTIGILMRNEEWAYNGKSGWAVRPFRAISADSVRNSEYSLPKDKPLSNASASTAYNSNDFKPLENDDDVPF